MEEGSSLIVINMSKLNIKEEIQIPEGVQIFVDSPIIKVTGPKGELKKKLFNPKINIFLDKDKLNLEIKNAQKKEKMFMKTFKAHIKNMIKGALEGFTYKLKICSGHFPMTVKYEQNKIIVSNFLGEKIPRKTDIQSNIDIEIKKDEIIVKGIDKELVSQTAANIERITRITKRDRRRFQDGIYIIEKDGVQI